MVQTNLAEELGELFSLCVLRGYGQTSLPQGLTEEVANIFPGSSECLGFLVLGRLSLKGTGEHVGEEL
jgi:hypothetical protein